MLDDRRTSPDIISSIIGRMNGFLYRCNNDLAYSMIVMAGNVTLLTGLQADEFTRPGGRSYSGMTHDEDLPKVYAAVDAALAIRQNWSVEYRIRRADGTDIWVHEVGGGVWSGDELLYLEGVVIEKNKSKLDELHNIHLLSAITEQTRILLGDTTPVVEVLRTLRVLAINARLEAGRAGPAGAAFGFVAQEMSRLADETSVLANHIAEVTGHLQALLKDD